MFVRTVVYKMVVGSNQDDHSKIVKQETTIARRVSETAMFLLIEVAPTWLPLVAEVVGAGSDPGCTGFGSNVTFEEPRPLASWANPTEAGSARKTEYTFFKKVSPTIHMSL